MGSTREGARGRRSAGGPDLTDAATYNVAFVTNFGGGTIAGVEAALIAGLMEGRAYYNIHTSLFPAGEIRGFFAQQVPEPATLTLLVGGVLIGPPFAARHDYETRVWKSTPTSRAIPTTSSAATRQTASARATLE